MSNIHFLSKVKVKRFLMYQKGMKEQPDGPPVQRAYTELTDNWYPNDVYTIIGAETFKEGYWHFQERSQKPVFIVEKEIPVYQIALNLRRRFRAMAEDLELVPEPSNPPQQVETQKVKLEIWRFQWPDGYADYVASPSSEDALYLLVKSKDIGAKDAAELTCNRQDLRGVNKIEGSVGAGKRWSNVLADLNGVAQYIGGTTGA